MVIRGRRKAADPRRDEGHPSVPDRPIPLTDMNLTTRTVTDGLPMAFAPNDTVKRGYALALRRLTAVQVPYVVGGAWGVEHYVPLGRATQDLDVMLDPRDVDRALATLAEAGAKVLDRDLIQVRVRLVSAEIDLVHHFAQGAYAVDRHWHRRGVPGQPFGVATLVAAPADLIWTKVFIAARHRFDGADVVHLIRATRQLLDWKHLRAVLAPYPRLLLAYLNLFGFCYPDDRDAVPGWLWDDLQADLELPDESGLPHVCRGTLLDHTSFTFDLAAKGLEDARQLLPRV